MRLARILASKRWRIPIWIWATALIANVVLLLLLWKTYGFSGSDGLQSVALIDTLIALLWYASLTSEVAEATRRQAEISAEQVRLSKRPCVVIECISEDRGGHHYYLRNLGLGPAVNVVYRHVPDAEDSDDGGGKWHHLGGVPATAADRVPEPIYLQLERDRGKPFHAARHFLRAESLDGLWIESNNLVVDTSGRLTHSVSEITLSDDEKDALRRKTIREAVRDLAHERQKRP